MLNPKQKVLLALYLDYNKNYPNPETITKELLGIDSDTEFFIALRKLEIEQLITGVVPRGPHGPFVCMEVEMQNITLNNNGIEYVEKLFGINSFWNCDAKINALMINAKGNKDLQSAFEFLDELKRKWEM